MMLVSETARHPDVGKMHFHQQIMYPIQKMQFAGMLHERVNGSAQVLWTVSRTWRRGGSRCFMLFIILAGLMTCNDRTDWRNSAQWYFDAPTLCDISWHVLIHTWFVISFFIQVHHSFWRTAYTKLLPKWSVYGHLLGGHQRKLGQRICFNSGKLGRNPKDRSKWGAGVCVQVRLQAHWTTQSKSKIHFG